MGQRIFINLRRRYAIREVELLYDFLFRYELDLLYLDKRGSTCGELFDEENQEVLRNHIDTVLVIIDSGWVETVQDKIFDRMADRDIEEIDMALIFNLNVIPVLLGIEKLPDFASIYDFKRSRISKGLAKIEAFKINRNHLDADFKRLAEEKLGLKLKPTSVNKEKENEHLATLVQQEKVVHTEAKILKDALIKQLPLKNPLPKDWMEMVYIEGGTFMMGSPESEYGHRADEVLHQVSVSSFYIGKYTVTNKQWSDFTNSDPFYPNSRNDSPVQFISWDDIQIFLENLNPSSGMHFRLPTEAEWEYACRAGTTTPFNTGENLNTDQAHIDGDYPYANFEKWERKPPLTDGYPPNAWGVCNMHGDMNEWCHDFYGDYDLSDNINPRGPSTGDCHVVRGGCLDDAAVGCRSAVRDQQHSDWSLYWLSFRLAVSV